MTSDEAFRELDNLIRLHPDKADIGAPVSDEAIRKAQDFLEISFPGAYIRFLRTWGTLAVGPIEFYNIVGTEFENSGIPNGVWFTYVKRKQVGLPKDLIVLLTNDGDEYHCLEIPSGRIVKWDVLQKKIIGQKSEDIFNFVLKESREWFI